MVTRALFIVSFAIALTAVGPVAGAAGEPPAKGAPGSRQEAGNPAKAKPVKPAEPAKPAERAGVPAGKEAPASNKPAAGRKEAAADRPAAKDAKPAGKEGGAVDGKMEPAGGSGGAGKGAGESGGAAKPPAEGEEADEPGEEQEDGEAANVAKPVPVEPVQVFGFEEWVEVGDVADRMRARLDTGALTSSLHVVEEELFERDGAKWVRCVVSDPVNPNGKRVRISAPLVRVARIKIPGGGSEVRKVVRLSLKIGERKLRTEFNLNNRDNMLCPVLVGRRALQDLGFVDAGRTDLADKKIFR